MARAGLALSGEAVRGVGWLAVAVIAIVGLYFLVFHREPLPLNHEAIGLGELHFVHDIIGVVLLGFAGFIAWRSRRAGRARAAV